MRKFRVLSDRLVDLVVPKVTAQGLWEDRYRCTVQCSSTAKILQHRRCHDSSGYCTAWTSKGCKCH
jgi:hypothetical protein